MKTYIINLESHDDIISTCDKMQWSKADRILLIWPRRLSILTRRIDLVLLKRQGDFLGSQLAIVTRDPEVHYHAPRLGIPVFKTLKRAQNARWRLPRRFRDQENDKQENQTEEAQLDNHRSIEHLFLERVDQVPRQLHPLKRLFFFTLGVLAFLSIAASLYPQAEFILEPKQQVQEITINITADTRVKEINISGIVPAQMVTVIVEGRSNLPVSGSVQLPDQPAIGYAQFTNLTNEPITISEGTIVRDTNQSNYRFSITQGGTVLAGPGNTINLPIRAVLPGKEGNLSIGSLNAIEGQLGTQLSVTNLTPIRHGSDRIELAPSEADQKELLSQLRRSLEQTALYEIQSTLGQDDILITSSLTLIRTIEERYQPENIQPADRLNLNLRLEYEAMAVYAEDLRHLAEDALNATIPPGFIPIQDTFRMENINNPKLNQDNNANWILSANRQLEAEIIEPLARQVTLGLEPEQAKKQLLQSLPLSRNPDILLTPSWWPRVPILPFRIMIVNANSNQ